MANILDHFLGVEGWPDWNAFRKCIESQVVSTCANLKLRLLLARSSDDG